MASKTSSSSPRIVFLSCCSFDDDGRGDEIGGVKIQSRLELVIRVLYSDPSRSKVEAFPIQQQKSLTTHDGRISVKAIHHHGDYVTFIFCGQTNIIHPGRLH
eukprot:scaffold7349_cov173-Amphora_coffeaeformis.AAC.133